MSANGFGDCCLPHGVLNCMNPKPAQTGLVNTTRIINRLQTKYKRKPESCPISYGFCIHMQNLLVEITDCEVDNHGYK